MLPNIDFIKLDQDEFITEFLTNNRVILIPALKSSLNSMYMLSLDELPVQPVNFREILLRWIIFVNRKRIENGEEIIITYDIIKRCPIWKVLSKMPLKSIKLESKAMNRPVKPVTVQKYKKVGSINKLSNKK
jgi:hypothetical protein